MRKIFILGGSDLQLDLILEAKKMFFYTIVLDMNEECIGAKWCDEFLHINIADKELVLQKAKEYEIDAILTSATELGNLTACFVGEKLGLNTNTYQTALNTTNKTLMKEILKKHTIDTAKHKVFKKDEEIIWNDFPCIVKPSDSSAGRGLSYCTSQNELQNAMQKAFKYTYNNTIIVEEYIKGEQYSIESISTDCRHQIIAINKEKIHPLPHVMEVSHTIPAVLQDETKMALKELIPTILNAFQIIYGASHIEIRITEDGKIYIIELASRTGGWRSEMINLAYGISYSQLLLLSTLNLLEDVKQSRNEKVVCNFLIDYKSYVTYKELKKSSTHTLFEPFQLPEVSADFIAEHTGKSMGYYFVLEATR